MSTRTIAHTIEWLSQYAARELNVTVQADGSTELALLGADSLEAVTMISELGQWLELELCPSMLWDCESMADIAHLAITGEIDMSHRLAATAAQDNAHPYRQFVNPALARKLEQLDLDKEFVRAEGSFVYDSEGRRYLDFMAQYGALPFGHNPPAIWQALSDSIARQTPCMVQPSLLRPAGELARRLIAIAPTGLNRVTFANSGAEAVEVAIKLCLQATQRKGILSTHRGFHGKTLGALSASGRAEYQSPFGLPLENFSRVAYGDLDALRAALEAQPTHFAAFIVEPIQGEGGVIEPPAGYLAGAKTVCNQYGVLLVVDEVQTGLGRTGHMFACEPAGVAPDVLTIAKALGGGLMPVAAVLCTESVFGEPFALKHSSTFGANTLAMQAGLATLDMLEQNQCAMLHNVQKNGVYLKGLLEDVQTRFGQLIESVHGRGMMLGIRFGVRREQWPDSFLGVAAEQKLLAQLIAAYLLNVEGLRVAPTLNQGDVLRVQPPLNATREQCAQAAQAIERCMEVLASGDTARLFGSILDRAERAATGAVMHPVREPAPVHEQDTHFGFLLHPLDAESFVHFDPTLTALHDAQLADFVDSMDGVCDPFIASTVRVESPTGATARGEFILIPRTTDAMLDMPREQVLEELRDGVRMARQRGAQIVGLGAYTSVLSGGGSDLADEQVPLTSGNSLTAVAGVDALSLALRKLHRSWRSSSAAVVGAAGSIGRASAILLGERVSQLILLGNPNRSAAQGRERLLDVATDVCRHLAAQPSVGVLGETVRALTASQGPDTDAVNFRELALALESSRHLILTTCTSALKNADLVITATNVTGSLFVASELKAGAIVCDQSRPRSVREADMQDRPDVLVIDGGLIEVPGRPYIGPYGLDKGLAYACMAETMLLALEGHLQHCSLGMTLRVQDTTLLRDLARRHGFEVAALQSFCEPVGETRWEQLRNALAPERALSRSPAA